MRRPNAVLTNVKDNNGKRWNVVYIRLENGTYTHTGSEYVKSDSPMTLDPFVNWLDYVPDREWVHPVHAITDDNGGWYLVAYDTYHESCWEGKSITLDKLSSLGLLFKCFDKLLDWYKNATDDELLEELNIGRIVPWTKEEFEKL